MVGIVPNQAGELVTGGSRGIGLGIARCLAKDGCDLVINGVRPESDVLPVLMELQDLGAQTLYCQADVGNTEDRAKLVETVKDQMGRLDVLVNNAGVAPKVRTDVLHATEESFERLVKINMQGPHFLTQLVAHWMIEQRNADPDFSGCIINITSTAAAKANITRPEYCMTKAALSMSTMVWAVRLAEFGIRVYEIRPGVILTDLVAAVKDAFDKFIEEGGLLDRRWGQPEDVGKAVAALVRGDLNYSTGQILNVDGGLNVPRF
jgi:3-oxoacyl-[acyl-carrier protein] reductase